MDTGMIKDILRNKGKAMLELAEKLSDNGRALQPHERKMINQVKADIFLERADEVAYLLWVDRPDSALDSYERLLQFVD